MGYTSLLVHTVDNNIDNIDILLDEQNLGADGSSLIGKIIQEQMNKILENAELYYLEDDNYAKNKDIVFLIEYIQNLFGIMLERYQKTGTTYFIFSTNYKGKKVKTDNSLLKIQQILNYLFIYMVEEVKEIQLDQIEEEIHIKLNLEKIQQPSLQIK